LPETKQINMLVHDVLGRVLAHYKKRLSRGSHSFTFFPGNEKYYLLTVTNLQTSKTIKMLNTANDIIPGGKCKIVYSKYEDIGMGFKTQNVANEFGFAIGDILKYTAYTDIETTEISDAPTISQTYAFQFDGWTPCPGMSVLTDVDGNTYNTVQVGDQCWMKENLRVGTMINGENDQTDNDTIERYCYVYYFNYCGSHGGLYQWDEMMQYSTDEGTQGICPTGWHIPSDADWKVLEMTLGMTQVQADSIGWRGTDEGGKLKESGPNYWLTPNVGATNSSGFSGMPGGNRLDGSFYNLTSAAFIWSSSEDDSDAMIRYLHYTNARIYRAGYDKTLGLSVRCVKN